MSQKEFHQNHRYAASLSGSEFCSGGNKLLGIGCETLNPDSDSRLQRQTRPTDIAMADVPEDLRQ